MNKSVRYALLEVQNHLANYSDAELREIKNSADVFSMHIRMELAARDARAVDEVLKEKAMGPRENAPHPMFRDHNCARCSSGGAPCVQGNPTTCVYPHARND